MSRSTITRAKRQGESLGYDKLAADIWDWSNELPKAQRSSLRADRQWREGQEPRQRSAEVAGGILFGLRKDEPTVDLNNA